MTPDELIAAATDYYLHTRDFKGYPGHHIHTQFGLPYEDIRDLFASLVSDGRGTIVFGDLHPIPHIRVYADEAPDAQLQKLEAASLEQACLYPSSRHLATTVSDTDYQDRPFTRELALGAGQLEFRSFDLSVLEIYRNDPRYRYSNDDVKGHICVTEEIYESDQMQKKDQVIMETFGFSYDDDMNRAVAAFLIYLSRLSPEHQHIWNSKRLTGKFRLHPDYYRNRILGNWGGGISVFNAFIEELKIINQMCAVMNRPPLFRDTFEAKRPRHFSFLVRPTQEEFNDFVLTLDKMMSDNIRKDFFIDEVPDEIEEARGDGKIVVRQRGTIAMLEHWFAGKFRPNDPKAVADMIVVFKKVRKLRQKPAHAIKADVFDQKFFRDQRDHIVAAYTAVMTLRQLLSESPVVRGANVEIPDVLTEGKIWTK